MSNIGVRSLYFAKALNQYYDSLEVISKYNDNMKGEMRTVTLEAITKFWEITHESHGSDMKIFVSLSWQDDHQLFRLYLHSEHFVVLALDDGELSQDNLFFF
jgi:hypothetical protein